MEPKLGSSITSAPAAETGKGCGKFLGQVPATPMTSATYIHTNIHMYIHRKPKLQSLHTYLHIDGQGLFVRPPYIHNATWASLGFSGPLWASLSLSQPAREPPAKRMTGLFYPRSGSLGLSGHLWASLGLSHPAREPPSQPASQPASSLVVILLVGTNIHRLPGRTSACT